MTTGSLAADPAFVFRVLRGPDDGERRRLAAELIRAHDPAEEATAVPSSAERLHSLWIESTRSAAARSRLDVFLAACDRLFDDVMDVALFDEPAAHVLFGLREAGIGANLQRLVSAPLAAMAGVPARAAVTPAELPPETLDAACIALAHGATASWQPGRLLGFAESLFGALAGLEGVPSAWSASACTRLRTAADPGGDALARHLGRQAFARAVQLLAGAAAPPHAQVCSMLEHKARHAVRHHGAHRLGGRCLRNWFEQSPFDAAGLLAALRQSDWVDRAEPERSRFFTQLCAAGGRMQGVFSTAEQQLLCQALQADKPAGGRQTVLGETPCVPAPRPASCARSSRDRFFALLQDGPYGTASALAQSIVEETFCGAVASPRGHGDCAAGGDLLYSEDVVRERVDRMYRAEPFRARALQSLPDTAAVLEMHRRFAPMALVDGCWLRRVSRLGAESPAMALLQGIHADEVGNGDTERNHARLFVRLLDQLGATPVPRRAADLAVWPDLPAQAFRLPAFLLALDLVADRWLAEILGVTLAIELSGLDGFYEWMISGVEACRADASFWRVHVTVDNYATGHARQALDAIVLHLEHLRGYAGEEAMQCTWRRIWNGCVVTQQLLALETSVVAGTSRSRRMGT